MHLAQQPDGILDPLGRKSYEKRLSPTAMTLARLMICCFALTRHGDQSGAPMVWVRL